MDKEDKLKIMSRFDNYFSAINNKSAFIISINTIIISAFLIKLKEIDEIIEKTDIMQFKLVTAAIILFSIFSILLTIIASIPALNSNDKSFWFFNDIANRQKGDFLKLIDKQLKKELNEDINEQIYQMSIALKKKYMYIKGALIVNFIQMFLFAFAVYLIIF